jgi:hypothetical protein
MSSVSRLVLDDIYQNCYNVKERDEGSGSKTSE